MSEIRSDTDDREKRLQNLLEILRLLEKGSRSRKPAWNISDLELKDHLKFLEEIRLVRKSNYCITGYAITHKGTRFLNAYDAFAKILPEIIAHQRDFYFTNLTSSE